MGWDNEPKDWAKPSPEIEAIKARIARTEESVPAELDALDILDPERDGATLRRLLAFALASRSRLGNVARVASLLPDDALLDRVFGEVSERLSQQLELAAYELLREDAIDPSFRIYMRLARCEHVSLQALNNFCWILLKVSKDLLPDDLTALMDKAERAAVDNVAIWHNLACAWVRFENTERALDAVEAAVKTDYHDLERMETDEDLAPLFDMPRYKAAFESLRQK